MWVDESGEGDVLGGSSQVQTARRGVSTANARRK
jgi:hypothetical protein